MLATPPGCGGPRRAGEASAERGGFFTNATQRREGADAIVFVTEWDASWGTDLDRVKTLVSQPLPINVRNINRRKLVECLDHSFAESRR